MLERLERITPTLEDVFVALIEARDRAIAILRTRMAQADLDRAWAEGRALDVSRDLAARLRARFGARLALHEGALRRFFLIVWHAMPALLLTGWALLFFWYGGFRGAGWHIHTMHLTGLVMAGVFAALFFGPFRAFRAARAAGDAPTASQLTKVNAEMPMTLGTKIAET